MSPPPQPRFSVFGKAPGGMRLGSNSWELIFFSTAGMLYFLLSRKPIPTGKGKATGIVSKLVTTGLHIMSVRYMSGSSVGNSGEAHG